MGNFDVSLSSVLAAAASSVSGLPSLHVGPGIPALLSASPSASELWPWCERCQVPACPPARVSSLHTALAVGVMLPFGVWVSSSTFAVLLLLVIVVVGDNWGPVSVEFPWHESMHCMSWAPVRGRVQGSQGTGLEGLVGPVKLVEVCPHCY